MSSKFLFGAKSFKNAFSDGAPISERSQTTHLVNHFLKMAKKVDFIKLANLEDFKIIYRPKDKSLMNLPKNDEDLVKKGDIIFTYPKIDTSDITDALIDLAAFLSENITKTDNSLKHAKGAEATNKRLSAKERSDNAKKAAKARWGKNV